jgi:RNA polymerase sigma factor (sigma-70 family)
MDDTELLARRFEAHRERLTAVAVRMLGSRAEADDAVQETWLRLSRSDADAIDNLGGWLTTVVGRVCLDALRARRARRDDPLDELPATPRAVDATIDPEHEAVLADSLGIAVLVVLDTLTPAERVAFVLHDMFAVPFDEIGPIVGRTPTATRQLASRARRRVQGGRDSTAASASRDVTHRRALVDAFLAAARTGDFEALLAVLDPDVVLRADAVAAASGGPSEVHGGTAVATRILERARSLRPALVDGTVDVVAAPGDVPRVVFAFTIEDDRIVEIAVIADPDHVGRLAPTILPEV